MKQLGTQRRAIDIKRLFTVRQPAVHHLTGGERFAGRCHASESSSKHPQAAVRTRPRKGGHLNGLGSPGSALPSFASHPGVAPVNTAHVGHRRDDSLRVLGRPRRFTLVIRLVVGTERQRGKVRSLKRGPCRSPSFTLLGGWCEHLGWLWHRRPKE